MKIFDETEMPNVMKPVLQVSLCAIIFVLSYFRSDKAGKLLAEALRKGLQGNRPVTLVGFSLGARVVFKCLQTLAETEKNAEIVERVVLLGAPISIKNENWRDVRKMVAGRFINVYATNDWTLGVAFRARISWNPTGLYTGD
jgi:pimeloyl-ACP methyl ester carboxylesterase